MRIQVKIARSHLQIAGVAAGMLGSFAAGWYGAKYALDQKYSEIAAQEIKTAREFYAKAFDKPDPEDLVAKYEDENVMMKNPEKTDFSEYAPSSEVPEGVNVTRAPAPEPTADGVRITRNLFASQTPVKPFEWDITAELQNRTEEIPYVISEDEYMETLHDWEQESLTFFEGDGVLANENNIPIVDIERKVTHRVLERFGHGSNDANIVYVRDESAQMEYEIHRSERTYEEDVMGGSSDDHLEHGDRRRPGRRLSD